MAILIAFFHANLFVAKLTKRTVSHSRVKDALEIRCESCQSLAAELTSAAEVFRAIAAVEAHTKSLNLQCSVGDFDVSLWEHLRDT